MEPTRLCDNDECFVESVQTCASCGNRYCAAHTSHEMWHTTPAP